VRVVGATRMTETFTPVLPGEYGLAIRSVDDEGVAISWKLPRPLQRRRRTSPRPRRE
jgi:hypothetical protein